MTIVAMDGIKIDKKLQGRNSAPLICTEVWDISHTVTHVCHNQYFEMLQAKESIDFGMHHPCRSDRIS
jgi:hypothetical protein